MIFIKIVKNNHLTLLSIAVLIDSNDLNAKMRVLSALAQLVEQMTVNHWVAGSSPAGGAKYKKRLHNVQPFFAPDKGIYRESSFGFGFVLLLF